MTRSDILNLNFDPNFQIIPTDSVDFQTHLNKLTSYDGKRYKDNYDPTTIQQLLDKGKFNIGIGLLYVNGILTRSVLLENNKGWIVLRRMVSWEYAAIPLLTTCALPKIYEYAEKNLHRGVYASVNDGNHIYFNCLKENNKKITSESKIFKKHREIVSQISLLEDPVLLNGVFQLIAYKTCTSDARIEELING